MHASWKTALAEEFSKPYFADLIDFVRQERASHIVHPDAEDTFAALRQPLDEVCVVIIGQDPYHGSGQAHGLAFSVPDGVGHPPTLRNILIELEADLGIPRPKTGCLIPWADQGVLLLNSVLTVRHGEPGSHAGHGWETFTDAVLRAVVSRRSPCAFVLWGAYARRKAGIVDGDDNTIVIESAHPSPMSASGFFGSRPFSRVNRFLVNRGLPAIDWRLR
jgi:uracil-DNA glycosylase